MRPPPARRSREGRVIATHGHGRTTTLLVGLGLLIAALLYLQLTTIARHDFYVAHHFGGEIPRLRLLAYGFCAVLIALGLVLHMLPDGRGGTPAFPASRLLAITLGGAVVFAALAFFTHPTRSQDIYWSLLLGKAASHAHLNPYRTVPSQLSQDPWAYPVLAWRDMPMTYGPLWTWIVILATRFTDSLGVALATMKLLFVALWALAGYLVWRIARLHELDPLQRARLLALFLWNPFVIQCGLVDLHNDLLVMLSLLASYALLLRRSHVASLLALVAGTLVKYVPVVIGLVPLWYLVKVPRPAGDKLRGIAIVAVVAVGVGAALFAPFGGANPGTFAGLAAQADRVGFPDVYLPGTAALIAIFHLSYAWLRMLGLMLAVATIALCLAHDRPLLGYTLPLLVLLFFATPWFQPWYGLWVLPLLMFAWPATGIVLLSMFLILTPELVTPAELSMRLPAVFFYAGALWALWRQATGRGREGAH